MLMLSEAFRKNNRSPAPKGQSKILNTARRTDEHDEEWGNNLQWKSRIALPPIGA